MRMKELRQLRRKRVVELGTLLRETRRFIHYSPENYDELQQPVPYKLRTLEKMSERRLELLRVAFEEIRKVDVALVYAGRSNYYPEELLDKIAEALGGWSVVLHPNPD